VAKTVAGTSASKRHRNKKGGPNGPPFIDSSRRTRRVRDAQKQTKIYRPNGNAPLERGSMPTQGLPMMPTVGKAAKTPQPKLQPTRAEAGRAAKARIMRRNSLRKQRDAQKGKILP
jgi:hypothetical protein